MSHFEARKTRYKLIVEYDGTPFCGWQRQQGQPSVQETLEEAIFRFSQERPVITASGRTDSGVHAMGQVVTFDLNRAFPAHKVRDGLNFHLRPSADQLRKGALQSVCVREALEVHPEFNARFSAIQRSYLYRIVNRRAHLVLDFNRAWFVPQPLDADAMHDAAQILVGQHDFSSFRAAECQAQSPVKSIDEITIRRVGEEVQMTISARSFLHHQVRNIIGSLKNVGVGKWTRDDLRTVLEARDRNRAGMMAPAAGLYFVSVDYEKGAEQGLNPDPAPEEE